MTRSVRRHRHAGQALAEFAIVLPVFLLLVVAGFDVGRGVFAYNSVTNAAREGARLAIVNQDTSLIAQRTLDQTWVAEKASPNVRVTFWKPTSTPNPNATSGDCTSIGYGCQALVRYETTYQPITPLIRNILFPSGVTFVATAVETIEYTCPSATVAAADCPKQP